MKKEDADKLIELFNEYYKKEIEFYKHLYSHTSSSEPYDVQAENLFFYLIHNSKEYSDFQEQIRRTWIFDIIYKFILKKEPHKFE